MAAAAPVPALAAAPAPAPAVNLDVKDHGKVVDKKKKRVQCHYCDKVVSGFYRLKCHLGGVRGDVTPCYCVLLQIRQFFKNQIEDRLRKKAEAAISQPTLSGNTGEEPNILRSLTTHQEPNVLSVRDQQRSIGRSIFKLGNELTVIANSPNFKRIMTGTSGRDHLIEDDNIPTAEDLTGWILEEEMKEMKQMVEQITDSWKETGCSILLDEWVDKKGHHLVNFLVYCPKGPVYLRSSDISAFSDDMDALLSLFDEVIDEIGEDNVVQVIASSTSNWSKEFLRRFEEKHTTIFWTVSVTHCISLMLDKIGMMEPMEQILHKAKKLTRFIHGEDTVFEMFKRNAGDDETLVKSSKITSATPFLTLQNIASKEEELKEMIESSEWKESAAASTMEGRFVSNLIKDETFWVEAEKALKATVPILRVLGLIHRNNKPLLGYIYETMDQAKEAIKTELKKYYMPVWKLMDNIWDTFLHSALHVVGYYLNPSFFYTKDFYIDEEVSNGLVHCIIHMVEERKVQLLISRQLEKYRKAEGAMRQGSRAKEENSIKWWYDYGNECPDLQRFAIRVLSQTCDGPVRYQLKKDPAENLLFTNGRSDMEQRCLKDLVFVHYNLQLQPWHSSSSMASSSDSNNNNITPEKAIVTEEIDPSSDWIMDNTERLLSQYDDKGMDLDLAERDTNEGGLSEGQPRKRPRQEF